MFRRLPDSARETVSVTIDGVPCTNYRGDTVAGALLAAGKTAFRRNAVSSRPRGPYCMMGMCFECLVRIDGAANQQACLIEIRDGMAIETGMRKEGA